MNKQSPKTWQLIHDEVLSRIQTGIWQPGQLIPREADLAQEFSCARATVNRALRELAEAGLLERRRKAGTRVAAFPTRRTKLHIPLIREEIESRGARYSYRCITRNVEIAPVAIAARLSMPDNAPLIYIEALHLADGRAYVFEDRWINPVTIPAAGNVDFSQISPNEWLIRNAPFSEGEISLQAQGASARQAEILDCNPAAALFVLERVTRTDSHPITFVTLSYAPGYRMQMAL